jgi:CheY-like chemotaxis protein
MRRALVVDDQKDIRDILSDILSAMGFEVAVAHSGNEGLNTFLKTSFDLVLTDLQMPGMDGRSLALRIKEQSSATPVVLMTGEAKDVVRDNLKGNCIDFVMSKPLRLEDIQRTIRAVLGIQPSTGAAEFETY